MADEPIIHVENLTTYYGERRILHNINLSIQPRETIVLLGSSGTGKSTMLRHVQIGRASCRERVYVLV